MINKAVPSHHGINQRLAREGLRAFFYRAGRFIS
jgi:hypothetical protein